ncbi:MAG: hypothetical protein FWG79_03975, partial [Bacteroidales bacterium]|nr:hypothetical protein [Bacteroidales bacterium]
VAGEGSDYGSVSLWKNGVAQSLTGVQANSVFVSGNDVYVGLWNGTLWKNGTVQYLPVQRGEARSVFVADGDVYVAGYVDYPLGAVLWKNGIEQRLTAGGYYAVGGYNAWANSVFVSDSDVYVA